MTRRSAPKGAPQTPARKSKRHGTCHHQAPNDPPKNHHDGGYWSHLLAEVESGEFEDVDQ